MTNCGARTGDVSQCDSSLPDADLRFAVDGAREAWEALRGGRLFLTGGTGFIGTWILEAFVRANRDLRLGATIEVLSRDPAAFLSRRPHLRDDAAVSFLAGDVRDFDVVGRRFTHLIHGATTSGGPVHPQEMFSVVVDGTKHVLDACKRASPLKSLLISSGAVYGRQPPSLTHVDEDFAGAPSALASASAYGEGKRAAELLAAMATEFDDVPFSIARCFAFVGPLLPLDAHFAVGNFIADVLAGRPITVGGDGTPRRSYLYAAELVAWLMTVLERGTPGRAYNVGSEHDVSIRELAETVARRASAVWPERQFAITVAKPPEPRELAAPSRYVPSCTRALKELGLRQQIGLADAIDRTIAFHLNRHGPA